MNSRLLIRILKYELGWNSNYDTVNCSNQQELQVSNLISRESQGIDPSNSFQLTKLIVGHQRAQSINYRKNQLGVFWGPNKLFTPQCLVGSCRGDFPTVALEIIGRLDNR